MEGGTVVEHPKIKPLHPLRIQRLLPNLALVFLRAELELAIRIAKPWYNNVRGGGGREIDSSSIIESHSQCKHTIEILGKEAPNTLYHAQ